MWTEKKYFVNCSKRHMKRRILLPHIFNFYSKLAIKPQQVIQNKSDYNNSIQMGSKCRKKKTEPR